MNNTPVTPDDNLRFPSLESLRAAHGELLKRFRAEGNTAELIAEVEAFIRRGQATGALLDADADRWAAQGQLDYWATQLYRPNAAPLDATLAEFDPMLAPELDDALCPYVGLDAFHEANQKIFFGRHHLADELIRKLQDARLLIVLGSSGSGKSSMVRAALIPMLKAGALGDSAAWTYFPPMVPGSNPLANLVRLLLPEADAQQIQDEAELFRQKPNHLARIAAERFHHDAVLVVDQFEEVFTLCADEAERRCFVDHLLNLYQTPNANHRVILTMRADFEANVARLPNLQEVFEPSAVRITSLSAAELREAIEAPAALIGLKFEEGVVNALLNDTLGEPAALPLLQFTLLKLWNNRDHNRVTWEAYKKLGGGRHALARTADEFYNQLIPEEQVTMRRILLKMVKPGEGLEVTSKRVPRSALYQKSEASDRIDRVLDKLIRARLVRVSEGDVAADEQVEVAHEALVRNWPRLVEWLEEERITLRQRQRLTGAAEEWLRLGREDSAVWRGVLLNEAHRYDDLNELETEFIQAGYEAEQAESRLEKVRRNKEQRAREFRLRYTVIASLIAALIFLALGSFGLVQSNVATSQAATAQSASTLAFDFAATAQANAAEVQSQSKLALARQIAAQAQSLLVSGKKPDTAVLLAIQSLKLFPTSDAAQVLQSNPLVGTISIMYHTDAVTSVAFSPDGKYVVSASNDNTVRIWEVSTGQEFSRMTFDDIINSVAFSPDAKYVVSGSYDNTTRVWEAMTGKEISRMTHDGSVITVAFSPDARSVVSGSADNTARVWDVATGNEISRMTHDGSVSAVAFSPNGKYVVSGSWDKTTRVWEAATGKEIDRMTSDGFVTSVALSPDGKYVISGSADKTARVWEVMTGKEIGRKLYDGEVLSVAFSPDGKNVVSGGGNTACVWNPETGKDIACVTYDGWTAIAFSPSGKYVVSGGCDIQENSNCTQGSAHVWDAVTGQEIARMIHDGRVNAFAFSPDGKFIVTGSSDHTARVWRYQTGDLIADACSRVTRNLTRTEWFQYYISEALPYQAVCHNLPIEAEVIITSTATP